MARSRFGLLRKHELHTQLHRKTVNVFSYFFHPPQKGLGPRKIKLCPPSYLDKLSVCRFCQVIGHQKIWCQKVENFQTRENHSEFVDDDNGFQRDQAKPCQQREHVSREKPDLFCFHDAGAERTYHQLTWKRDTGFHNQADYPRQEKKYFNTLSFHNTVINIQHIMTVLTRTYLLWNQAPPCLLLGHKFPFLHYKKCLLSLHRLVRCKPKIHEQSDAD